MKPSSHRPWNAAVAAAFALAVAAAGCAPEPRAGPDEAADEPGTTDPEATEALARALEPIVERAVASDDTAGGMVARVETGSGEATVAAGPADVEGAQELSGDEAFRVASITKMLTATVALQLAEDGAVDLDAPVADVVPERAALFQHGDDVTLRHLLGHTGGLPEYFGTEALDEAYVADALARAEIEGGAAAMTCDAVAGFDPLSYAAEGETAFEPGEGWAYSNTGYWLAGEVIEAAAGQPFAEVLRERVLDPLGMDDTWLDCPEPPRAELATGLHPPGAYGVRLPGQDDAPFDVTGLQRDLWATGGLVSTAHDLTRFARALFSGALFRDEATLEAMLEAGPEPSYGLGVRLGDGGTVGHGGLAAGYTSGLRYAPDQDAAVVALTNATAPGPRRDPTARAVDAALELLDEQ